MILICCSCDLHTGGDALKCGRDRGHYMPCGCECHTVPDATIITAVFERIGRASAEIADRWEEIMASGTKGRASEEMLGHIIEKYLTGRETECESK